MENKLIDKLRFYMMNAIDENKDVDSNVIIDIIDILINYYKLESWVRNINVTINEEFNNNMLSLGFYNWYDKQMTFHINAIKYFVGNFSNSFSFSIPEKKYFTYCILLIAILHEIEHANQNRVSESDAKDLESLIIQNSVFIDTAKLLEKGYKVEDIEKHCKKINSKEFQKENYNISPIERLASIKALDTTYHIFDFKYGKEKTMSEMSSTELILNIVISDIKSYIIDNLNTAYKNGYDRYISPTITYIQRTNPFADLEEILAKSKGLSPTKRIIYGLQISNNEQAENENKETTNGKILIK